MDEDNHWVPLVELLKRLNISCRDIIAILELSSKISSESWSIGYDTGFEHGLTDHVTD